MTKKISDGYHIFQFNKVKIASVEETGEFLLRMYKLSLWLMIRYIHDDNMYKVHYRSNFSKSQIAEGKQYITVRLTYTRDEE